MIELRNKGEFLVVFQVGGALAVDNALNAFKVPFPARLKAINAKLVTAGVTGSMIVDINKNGTTIFSGALKLTFATTAVDPTYDTFATDPTTFDLADMLSLDVDSVHTIPAEGLVVELVLERQRISGSSATETGTIGSDAEN